MLTHSYQRLPEVVAGRIHTGRRMGLEMAVRNPEVRFLPSPVFGRNTEKVEHSYTRILGERERDEQWPNSMILNNLEDEQVNQ